MSAPDTRFDPTRESGLARLATFAPQAGASYAANRNYDYGPQQPSAVSMLSPWIKHRLITETDVLRATLDRHRPDAAMKFIHEVFWRGYFKGWLEHHPSVWRSYAAGVARCLGVLQDDTALHATYTDAIAGRTGIACFDHWCAELKDTGYLHNHARMWFASIWIFTLRLPWELGADFFLRHLVDGDPASNTLSWRWVGGLHTKGKTYLARASNIAEFTQGRFDPEGQLAQTAHPLTESDTHPLVPLPPVSDAAPTDYLLLITPEDCSPESVVPAGHTDALGLCLPAPEGQSDHVAVFAKAALSDALVRTGAPSTNVSTTQDWTTAIIEAAGRAGTDTVLTARAPIGPVASHLETVTEELKTAGITLSQITRPYDSATWPHATKGFFKLKKKIPQIMEELSLI